MDIGSITSAYSALKSIKEIGTALLDQKIDSEAKRKVNEVMEELGTIQDTLFFIREELLQIQEEKQSLKSKIVELEKALELKGRVVWNKPSYWTIANEIKDGPFCQKCYDSDNKLIRLQGGGNDKWVCMECKSPYYGPDYKPPKRITTHKSSWLEGRRRW